MTAITALLELTFRAEDLDGALAQLDAILVDTAAFAGNQGVEVIVDLADPAHVVVVERWESQEADDAYRAWRAGEGKSALGSLLSGPPTLTRFRTR